MVFLDDGPAKIPSQSQVATREVWKTFDWLRSLGTQRTTKVPPTMTFVDCSSLFCFTSHPHHGPFSPWQPTRWNRMSLHKVQKTKTTEPAIFMDVFQEKSLNMGFVALV